MVCIWRSCSTDNFHHVMVLFSPVLISLWIFCKHFALSAAHLKNFLIAVHFIPVTTKTTTSDLFLRNEMGLSVIQRARLGRYLICKRGAFVIQRHNELRDLEAYLLSTVCSGVTVEPVLKNSSVEGPIEHKMQEWTLRRVTSGIPRARHSLM